VHHWISVVCGPKFIKFFSLNVEVVVVERVFFPLFDMLIRFGDTRDQSWTLQKSTEFCMFWPQIFLGERPPPEFLDVKRDSDHVAKFQGDRSRELGDPALKKTSRQNISPSSRSGRPKYAEYVMFAVCI